VTDVAEIRLDPGQLEQLAELVAESIGRRSSRLVTAREVAEHLSVDEGYVYEHAVELGARRLGTGPRARLRFSLTEVDERLSTRLAGRGSRPESPASRQTSHRRRRQGMGTRADLLPIRGQIPCG
jgi:hypothetical protein